MSMTEQQKKMVEDNHNLIYSFLSSHNLSIDEYYDLAAIGLCKAAMMYDASKSMFSTYAYRSMWTHVFAEDRKKKSMKRIPENKIVYYQAEMDDNENRAKSFMDYIPSEGNTEEDVLLDIMLKEYMNNLKDRDRKVFVLFSEGYTQMEISRMLGISQAQISRMKKKLTDYLMQ